MGSKIKMVHWPPTESWGEGKAKVTSLLGNRRVLGWTVLEVWAAYKVSSLMLLPKGEEAQRQAQRQEDGPWQALGLRRIEDISVIAQVAIRL